MRTPFPRFRATPFLAFTLLLFCAAASAEIQVFLERDTISLNETVRLIIKSDDASVSASPDLSVLSQNFILLGTSTSQNISISGNTQVSEKTWVTEMEPKKEGVFTIPSIVVGSEKTRPVRLTVLPENASGTTQGKDIFLELEVSEAPHRVQQQILLTVRLHLGVSLLDGNLTDPAPQNTDVRRLGQDAQYTANVNGRSYRVIERKYALFPENSGPLRIPEMRFQGLVSDNRSSNQTFSRLFNQGTRVSARTRAQTLDILAPPADFDGPVWLPASDLEILEPDNPVSQATAGQPVTRRIQIRATGLTAEQLPDPQFSESPSFRQYPDRSVRETLFDGSNLVGTVTRSIAIIANQPGTLTLPPVRITWWDTDTATRKVAVLPASEIQVLAAAAEPPDPAEHQPDAGPVPTAAGQQVTAPSTSNWMWAALILLVGWIATSLVMWRKLRQLRGVSRESLPQEEPASHDPRQLLSDIAKAGADHQPDQARELTIQLARNLWGSDYGGGLQEMAHRIGTGPMPEKLDELNDVLYASGHMQTEAWDGDAYAKCLADWVRSMNRKRDTKGSELPVLYPVSA